jgi:hypothetical protein
LIAIFGRAAAHDIVAGRKRRLHPWLQQRQLLKGSAVERQVPDFAFADEAAHCARRQVERYGVAPHPELFGNDAELERGVEDRNLTHGETNAATGQRPEARQLDMDLILPWRKRRHLEVTCLIRRLFVSRACRGVLHYDRGAGQHSALCIPDGPLNACTHNLGQNASWYSPERDERESEQKRHAAEVMSHGYSPQRKDGPARAVAPDDDLTGRFYSRCRRTQPGPLRVNLPDDATATGLRVPSYAKCETVGPVHKSHLKARIGRLPSTTWPAIDAGLCRVLGIRID